MEAGNSFARGALLDETQWSLTASIQFHMVDKQFVWRVNESTADATAWYSEVNILGTGQTAFHHHG